MPETPFTSSSANGATFSDDLRRHHPAGGVFPTHTTYHVPAAAYVCFAAVGERRQALTLGAPDQAGIHALTTLVAGFTSAERDALVTILSTSAFAHQLISAYVGPTGRPYPRDMVLSPDNLLTHWDRVARQTDDTVSATLASTPAVVRLFVTAVMCAIINGGTHPSGSKGGLIRPVPTLTTVRVTRGVQGFNDMRLGFWMSAFAVSLTKLIASAAKHIDDTGSEVKYLSIHTVGEACQAFFQSLHTALMQASLPDRTLLVVIGEVRRRLCTGTFSRTAMEAYLEAPLSALLANLNLVLLALDPDVPAAQLAPTEAALIAQHLERFNAAMSPALALWDQVPAATFAGYFEVQRQYRLGSPLPLAVTVSRRVNVGPLIHGAQTVYLASTAPTADQWMLLNPLSPATSGAPETSLSATHTWEALHGEGLRGDVAKLLQMNGPWHSVSMLQLVPSEELWLLAIIHTGRLDLRTQAASAWVGLHEGGLEVAAPLPGLDGRPAPLPKALGTSGERANPGEYYDIHSTSTVPLTIDGTLHVMLSDPRIASQLPLVGIAEAATQDTADFEDPLFALSFGRLRTGITPAPYPVRVFEVPRTADGQTSAFPYMNLAAHGFPDLSGRTSAAYSTAPFSPVAFESRTNQLQAGRGRQVDIALPPSVRDRLVDPRTGATRAGLTMRVAGGDLIAGPLIGMRVADTLGFAFGGAVAVRMMSSMLAVVHTEAMLKLHQIILQLPPDAEAARVMARKTILQAWMRASLTPFARTTIAWALQLSRVLTFVDQTTVDGAIIVAATKVALTREIIAAITDAPGAYDLWLRMMEDVDLMRALEENVLELLDRPLHVASQLGGEGDLT